MWRCVGVARRLEHPLVSYSSRLPRFDLACRFADTDARSSFINTIVRTAILISTMQSQSRQRLPVSVQDSTPDSPRDSTATEGPPSYAASEATLPAYPDAETLGLDEEVGVSRKGGAQDTSVASSSTLSGPAATPRSSEDSDSDDDREDRPLLHI